MLRRVDPFQATDCGLWAVRSESGKQIMTVEVDYHPRAVDTPEDLERVKAILAESPGGIRPLDSEAVK